MPDPDVLLRQLAAVERLGQASRLTRLLRHPLRYARTMWHREVTYPRTRTEWVAACRTAFGDRMHLRLPAGADVFLTGGKTHDSEVRLARFLIARLRPGDGLADVGAHFGYFTLLAARLVGPHGYVLALEAAPRTYATLADNVDHLPQVDARHAAAAAAPGRMRFHEFPARYSEYNSFDVSQFEREPWFGSHPPRVVDVATVALGEVLAQAARPISVIKVDVEGAEDVVVAGARDYLRAASPIVVLEYLGPARGNAPHRAAAAELHALGYAPHAITAAGTLAPVGDVEAHLARAGADSDNIAFARAA